MVFTHISVKGWIIDPYVQSLFYCSHLIQVLPPNNVEVVNGNIVTGDVTVVIYRSYLCIESLPTQISTCSGTVTTP